MEDEKVIQNLPECARFVDKHNIKEVSVKIFESKKGYKTFGLELDLGYKKTIVCFNQYTLAELVNLSVHDFYELPYGNYPLIKK